MGSEKKTVIMSSGDKGGAGKSTSARLIGEVLSSHDQFKNRLVLFDGDSANPDLVNVFGARDGMTTGMFSPTNPADINHLADSIFSAAPGTVILLDMPAGAGQHIKEDSEMFQALFSQPDIEFHMVWTLNTGAVGVEQLNRMADVFQDVPVKWTVVKNLFYGEPDSFIHWDSSATKKRLEKTEGGLVTTTIPKMADDSLKALGSASFSEAAANKDPNVPFSARLRAGGYLKKAADAFDHLIPKGEKKEVKGEAKTG